MKEKYKNYTKKYRNNKKKCVSNYIFKPIDITIDKSIELPKHYNSSKNKKRSTRITKKTHIYHIFHNNKIAWSEKQYSLYYISLSL